MPLVPPWFDILLEQPNIISREEALRRRLSLLSCFEHFHVKLIPPFLATPQALFHATQSLGLKLAIPKKIWQEADYNISGLKINSKLNSFDGLLSNVLFPYKLSKNQCIIFDQQNSRSVTYTLDQKEDIKSIQDFPLPRSWRKYFNDMLLDYDNTFVLFLKTATSVVCTLWTVGYGINNGIGEFTTPDISVVISKEIHADMRNISNIVSTLESKVWGPHFITNISRIVINNVHTVLFDTRRGRVFFLNDSIIEARIFKSTFMKPKNINIRKNLWEGLGNFDDFLKNILAGRYGSAFIPCSKGGSEMNQFLYETSVNKPLGKSQQDDTNSVRGDFLDKGMQHLRPWNTNESHDIKKINTCITETQPHFENDFFANKSSHPNIKYNNITSVNNNSNYIDRNITLFDTYNSSSLDLQENSYESNYNFSKGRDLNDTIRSSERYTKTTELAKSKLFNVQSLISVLKDNNPLDHLPPDYQIAMSSWRDEYSYRCNSNLCSGILVNDKIYSWSQITPGLPVLRGHIATIPILAKPIIQKDAVWYLPEYGGYSEYLKCPGSFQSLGLSLTKYPQIFFHQNTTKQCTTSTYKKDSDTLEFHKISDLGLLNSKSATVNKKKKQTMPVKFIDSSICSIPGGTLISILNEETVEIYCWPNFGDLELIAIIQHEELHTMLNIYRELLEETENIYTHSRKPQTFTDILNSQSNEVELIDIVKNQHHSDIKNFTQFLSTITTLCNEDNQARFAITTKDGCRIDIAVEIARPWLGSWRLYDSEMSGVCFEETEILAKVAKKKIRNKLEIGRLVNEAPSGVFLVDIILPPKIDKNIICENLNIKANGEMIYKLRNLYTTSSMVSGDIYLLANCKGQYKEININKNYEDTVFMQHCTKTMPKSEVMWKNLDISDINCKSDVSINSHSFHSEILSEQDQINSYNVIYRFNDHKYNSESSNSFFSKNNFNRHYNKQSKVESFPPCKIKKVEFRRSLTNNDSFKIGLLQSKESIDSSLFKNSHVKLNIDASLTAFEMANISLSIAFQLKNIQSFKPINDIHQKILTIISHECEWLSYPELDNCHSRDSQILENMISDSPEELAIALCAEDTSHVVGAWLLQEHCDLAVMLAVQNPSFLGSLFCVNKRVASVLCDYAPGIITTTSSGLRSWITSIKKADKLKDETIKRGIHDTNAFFKRINNSSAQKLISACTSEQFKRHIVEYLVSEWAEQNEIINSIIRIDCPELENLFRNYDSHAIEILISLFKTSPREALVIMASNTNLLSSLLFNQQEKLLEILDIIPKILNIFLYFDPFLLVRIFNKYGTNNSKIKAIVEQKIDIDYYYDQPNSSTNINDSFNLNCKLTSSLDTFKKSGTFSFENKLPNSTYCASEWNLNRPFENYDNSKIHDINETPNPVINSLLGQETLTNSPSHRFSERNINSSMESLRSNNQGCFTGLDISKNKSDRYQNTSELSNQVLDSDTNIIMLASENCSIINSISSHSTFFISDNDINKPDKDTKFFTDFKDQVENNKSFLLSCNGGWIISNGDNFGVYHDLNDSDELELAFFNIDLIAVNRIASRNKPHIFYSNVASILQKYLARALLLSEELHSGTISSAVGICGAKNLIEFSEKKLLTLKSDSLLSSIGLNNNFIAFNILNCIFSSSENFFYEVQSNPIFSHIWDGCTVSGLRKSSEFDSFLSGQKLFASLEIQRSTYLDLIKYYSKIANTAYIVMISELSSEINLVWQSRYTREDRVLNISSSFDKNKEYLSRTSAPSSDFCEHSLLKEIESFAKKLQSQTADIHSDLSSCTDWIPDDYISRLLSSDCQATALGTLSLKEEVSSKFDILSTSSNDISPLSNINITNNSFTDNTQLCNSFKPKNIYNHEWPLALGILLKKIQGSTESYNLIQAVSIDSEDLSLSLAARLQGFILNTWASFQDLRYIEICDICYDDIDIIEKSEVNVALLSLQLSYFTYSLKSSMQNSKDGFLQKLPEDLKPSRSLDGFTELSQEFCYSNVENIFNFSHNEEKPKYNKFINNTFGSKADSTKRDDFCKRVKGVEVMNEILDILNVIINYHIPSYISILKESIPRVEKICKSIAYIDEQVLSYPIASCIETWSPPRISIKEMLSVSKLHTPATKLILYLLTGIIIKNKNNRNSTSNSKEIQNKHFVQVIGYQRNEYLSQIYRYSSRLFNMKNTIHVLYDLIIKLLTNLNNIKSLFFSVILVTIYNMIVTCFKNNNSYHNYKNNIIIRSKVGKCISSFMRHILSKSHRICLDFYYYSKIIVLNLSFFIKHFCKLIWYRDKQLNCKQDNQCFGIIYTNPILRFRSKNCYEGILIADNIIKQFSTLILACTSIVGNTQIKEEFTEYSVNSETSYFINGSTINTMNKLKNIDKNSFFDDSETRETNINWNIPNIRNLYEVLLNYFLRDAYSGKYQKTRDYLVIFLLVLKFIIFSSVARTMVFIRLLYSRCRGMVSCENRKNTRIIKQSVSNIHILQAICVANKLISNDNLLPDSFIKLMKSFLTTSVNQEATVEYSNGKITMNSSPDIELSKDDLISSVLSYSEVSPTVVFSILNCLSIKNEWPKLFKLLVKFFEQEKNILRLDDLSSYDLIPEKNLNSIIDKGYKDYIYTESNNVKNVSNQSYSNIILENYCNKVNDQPQNIINFGDTKYLPTDYNNIELDKKNSLTSPKWSDRYQSYFKDSEKQKQDIINLFSIVNNLYELEYLDNSIFKTSESKLSTEFNINRKLQDMLQNKNSNIYNPERIYDESRYNKTLYTLKRAYLNVIDNRFDTFKQTSDNLISDNSKYLENNSLYYDLDDTSESDLYLKILLFPKLEFSKFCISSFKKLRFFKNSTNITNRYSDKIGHLLASKVADILGNKFNDFCLLNWLESWTGSDEVHELLKTTHGHTTLYGTELMIDAGNQAIKCQKNMHGEKSSVLLPMKTCRIREPSIESPTLVFEIFFRYLDRLPNEYKDLFDQIREQDNSNLYRNTDDESIQILSRSLKKQGQLFLLEYFLNYCALQMGLESPEISSSVEALNLNNSTLDIFITCFEVLMKINSREFVTTWSSTGSAWLTSATRIINKFFKPSRPLSRNPANWSLNYTVIPYLLGNSQLNVRYLPVHSYKRCSEERKAREELALTNMPYFYYD